VPVVASGGRRDAGAYGEVLLEGRADAVLAAAFSFWGVLAWGR